MVSEQAVRFERVDEFRQDMFMRGSIGVRDQYVHITARLCAASITTARRAHGAWQQCARGCDHLHVWRASGRWRRVRVLVP